MTSGPWVVLAIVAAGASGALAFELRVAPRQAPVATIHLVPAPTASRESGTDHAKAALATVLARPLFNVSRRPAAGFAAAPGMAMPRLTGIVIDGTGGRAIFAGSSATRPIVVKDGDALGEWSVRAIAQDAVTLAGPAGIKVLHPGFAKSKPEPSRPMAAAPPRPAQAEGR